MSGQHHPDAEASPPLPAAVRAVLVEAFARGLLRYRGAAGVLPQPTSDSSETDSNLSQKEVIVERS
jgi:hypothetical protein